MGNYSQISMSLGTRAEMWAPDDTELTVWPPKGPSDQYGDIIVPVPTGEGTYPSGNCF